MAFFAKVLANKSAFSYEVIAQESSSSLSGGTISLELPVASSDRDKCHHSREDGLSFESLSLVRWIN